MRTSLLGMEETAFLARIGKLGAGRCSLPSINYGLDDFGTTKRGGIQEDLRWSAEVGWYWLLPVGAAGQPSQDLMDFLGTFKAVCACLLVLAAWVWICWRRNSRGTKRGWEPGPFLNAPDEEPPQEESGTESEGARGLEGSGMGHDDPREVCALIGSLDPRSSWMPMHFLRGLLLLVGGLLFEFVGTDQVEVWRLREVARTFRYGRQGESV